MLTVPVAVAFSDRAWWRWVVGPLAAGAAMALFQRVVRWRRVETLALASAATMALVTAVYVVGALPALRRTESVRPAAAKIDAALAGERTAMLRPGFVPFVFYLGRSPVYLQRAGRCRAPCVICSCGPRTKPGPSPPSLDRQTLKNVEFIYDKRVHSAEHPGWVLLRFGPPGAEGLVKFFTNTRFRR